MVSQNSNTLLVFEFPFLLNALLLQFLFTRVSFLRTTAVPGGTAESAY